MVSKWIDAEEMNNSSIPIMADSRQTPTVLSTVFQTAVEAVTIIVFLWLLRSKIDLKWQRRVLLIAIEIIATIIVIPHLLVMCVPCSVWQVGVALYLSLWKYKKHSKTLQPVKILRGTDSIWLQEGDECLSIINVLLVMEGEPNLAQLRRVHQERLVDAKISDKELWYPKLSQYYELDCGYWCWKPEPKSYGIEDHIRYHDDLTSNDEIVDEERLMELVSLSSNRRYRPQMSPWEVLLVPNVKCGSTTRKYAMINRVHHSIGDGISLTRLILSNLNDHKLPDHVLPKMPKLTFLDKCLQTLCTISYLPIALLSHVATTEVNSLHGPKLHGDKITVVSKPVPLEVLKKIKNATNTTVSDVLMAAVSASLNAFFHDRKVVPHTVTGIMTVALKPPKEVRLENHFSIATITLPTASMSIMERLREMKKYSTNFKKSPQLLANYWALRVLARVLPHKLSSLLMDHSTSTLVISNVPGPTTPITLLGHTMTDFMFWLPNKKTTGVGISLLSYNGRVRVGIIVDKILINDRKDAQFLADYWLQHIEKMHTYVNSIPSSLNDNTVKKNC